MKTGGSSLYSQERASGHDPEPNKSNQSALIVLVSNNNNSSTQRKEKITCDLLTCDSLRQRI
jgi:hypothetical protein